MAINKSQSPAWVKIVIWVVALSFVASGIGFVVSAGLGSGGTPDSGTATGDATVGIDQQYQPAADVAYAAAQAAPDNPDLLTEAGHRYFEWAVGLYESGQPGAAVPYWLTAVNFYDKALAIRPDDPVVLGNKAFALYYAASPEAEPALRAFIEGDSANTTGQLDTARQMLTDLTGGASVPTTGTP